MVKLSEIKDLNRSEFLTPDDVKTGDVIEIVDEGTFVPASESRFGRPVFQIRVRLPSGEEKIWTVNKTTLRELSRAYGDETKNWVGKKVGVEVVTMNVRGVMRNVIFGHPVVRAGVKAEVEGFVDELRRVYGKEVDYTTFDRFLHRVRGIDVPTDEAVRMAGCKVEERDGKKVVVLG